MPAPTRPVAPPQALRSNPDTFSVNAELSIQYQWGALPAWIEAMGDFVQDQADAATAAVLTGDVAPDISKAGNFLRVNAAGTGLEYQQGLSGRNLIINGSGRINQRGYVSGTNTSGANQFTLDRWFVVTSGQNLPFTGNTSGRTMTAPAGGVRQVIEGANIVGGTYVLNWTGTAAATVNGTARTKGQTFTLTANTNVVVEFASGTFTDVQLELGSAVTPFERRSISQELALCERYLEIGVASLAGTTTGSTLVASVNFRATKRASPTVTQNNARETLNVTTTGASNINTYGYTLSVTPTGSGFTRQTVDFSADAELTS